MKRLFWVTMVVFAATLFVSCSGGKPFHKTAMPDPQSFNAHFGDMDADANDLVSLKEFNAYFKQDQPNVFKALDLDDDGSVDHDEWHQFKKAHGLKHKE